MASLWKRPESKYFTACWTDANGRRMKRSTKKTSKKEAEKLARLYEEESRRKRSAKQARQVLSDIYREMCGEALPTMTVREFFTSFVARKKPEVSKATYDYYSGHSKRFLAWLAAKADSDIASITRTDITNYRNHAAMKTGPRATNNTLKAIKTFFAAARKDGLLSEDPAADVDTVRDRSEAARRPFTLDELRAVLAVANEEWRSMILFGLYTGLRLSDIACLTWANIDSVNNEVRLTTRKTGRRQTLPLAPPLREHLTKLKAGDDPKEPLHPRASAMVQRTGRSGKLSDQFADLLVSAGLRQKEVTPEDGNARAKHELSFHSLRHTATSLLKTAGIPQSVVMDYIGHDSADVSHGYTHTGREALERAAAVFPEL
jgi:integrase